MCAAERLKFFCQRQARAHVHSVTICTSFGRFFELSQMYAAANDTQKNDSSFSQNRAEPFVVAAELSRAFVRRKKKMTHPSDREARIVAMQRAHVDAPLDTRRRGGRRPAAGSCSARAAWGALYCALAAASRSATLFQLMMLQMFLMYSARAGP